MFGLKKTTLAMIAAIVAAAIVGVWCLSPGPGAAQAADGVSAAQASGGAGASDASGESLAASGTGGAGQPGAGASDGVGQAANGDAGPGVAGTGGASSPSGTGTGTAGAGDTPSTPATNGTGGGTSSSSSTSTPSGTQGAATTTTTQTGGQGQAPPSSVVTTPPPAAPAQNTCVVSIDCLTILSNMGKLAAGKESLVPQSGFILTATPVSFTEGETVYDVLLRVCRDNKIHMEHVATPLYNSEYIEGIANLYEFDCGNLSGWMYSVNGWYPNYGCSAYKLKNGDVIQWRYTCDLGADVGGGGATQG